MTLSEACHKATVLLRDKPVMCTGWRYHCCCTKCQVGGGLVDRYVQALVRDDEADADFLRGEITRQQHKLAKQPVA